MTVRIDTLDRNILKELHEVASTSSDEIVRKAESLKTPIWNRIRKLTAFGAIKRQTVLLDSDARRRMLPNENGIEFVETVIGS